MNSKKPDVHADGRYSIKEVTEILGISRSTLHRYTEKGVAKCGRRKANNRPFYTGKEVLRIWVAMY